MAAAVIAATTSRYAFATLLVLLSTVFVPIYPEMTSSASWTLDRAQLELDRLDEAERTAAESCYASNARASAVEGNASLAARYRVPDDVVRWKFAKEIAALRHAAHVVSIVLGQISPGGMR